MAISRLPKASETVREFFSKSTQKVFTLEELDFILQEYITKWALPVSNVEDFEKQLVQSNILRANEFHFEERIKSQIRFWSPKADIYDVAVSLIPRAHLSHITALFLLGIVRKPPKSIYITSEQSKKESSTHTSELEQDKIDYAFSKPQRQTNTKCRYSGKEIIALNGMFTNKAGIINISGKPVTSLERTLIDITVRPSYGGGVSEVFKAFIRAKNDIDVDVLINLLDSINYTYPYYQSIGFYLEKAGYDTLLISKLRKRKKFVNFYLDYAIEHPDYSEEWRIFYPKKLKKEFKSQN
jgi:predicted transcriptional regulator of viral defense system